MIGVRKKEGETSNALFFRFSKKVKRSGVLREARKRRFLDRTESRQKRRKSAQHREKKKAEVMSQRRAGIFSQ